MGNLEENNLTKTILEVVTERKPQSVKKLTELLKKRIDKTDEEILDFVVKLQDEGLLSLHQPFQSRRFEDYLKSTTAVWYWLTIVLGVAAVTSAFVISDAFFPWVYARNLFGVAFVLFLPGYAFIKAVSPIGLSFESSKGAIANIEQLVLSFGVSFSLVSIIGMLLYFFKSWNMLAMVLSLFVLTSIFSTVAVFRGFKLGSC